MVEVNIGLKIILKMFYGKRKKKWYFWQQMRLATTANHLYKFEAYPYGPIIGA